MKLYNYYIYMKENYDLYLFIFLIINPLISLIGYLFPFLINWIPDNTIFLIRFFVLLIPMIKQRKNVNYYSVLILITLLFLIFISSINSDNFYMIRKIFVNGSILLIYVLFLYLSMNNNPKEIYDTYVLTSYILVIILIISALIGYYGEYAQFRYMEFSHTIIIYWIFILSDVMKNNKNIKYIIFTVFTGVIIALLSNRAILLNISITFFVFLNIYISSKKIKVIINRIIIFFSAIFLLFFSTIKNILLNFLALFNVNSYSLINLELGTFFSSSSRITIWKKCLYTIKENPFFGNGIGADRVIIGDVGGYAHNFLIELWIDYGIIIGTFFCMIYLIAIIKLLKTEEKIWRDLILPFFITSIIILSLSKSIYILPELWISIAILCSYYWNKKKRLIK